MATKIAGWKIHALVDLHHLVSISDGNEFTKIECVSGFVAC
jgi:hypothetical protein